MASNSKTTFSKRSRKWDKQLKVRSRRIRSKLRKLRAQGRILES